MLVSVGVQSPTEIKKSDAGSAGGVDVLVQVEKLAKLKEAGVLSEEEFNVKKAVLLEKL